MAALLDQATAPQHQDAIGCLHRGQAVGDHDGGALAQQAVEVALQGGLGGGIEEGRGLIHHQHRRITDRHPRHGQQLTLAGGEVAAALAQLGVEAGRQALQQWIEAQLGAEALQVWVADRGIEAQVVGHVAAEQECVLQDHTEPMAQGGNRQLADIDAIQQDPALLRLIKPAEQADHGGLAGTGGAHQRHMLAGFDPEGEVREDRLVVSVGEGNVLEDHLTGAAALAAAGHSRCRALISGQLADLHLLFQQLPDPLHGGESPLDLGEALGQLAQRIEQALGKEDEGGEGAETHGTGGDHPAAQGQHRGDRRQRHPLDQGGNG